MSKQIGTMTDFYEWVKGRNPAETYDYFDTCDCAVARYCRDRGVKYDADPKSLLEWAAQQDGQQRPGQRGRGLTMAGLRKEIEEFFLCKSPSL